SSAILAGSGVNIGTLWAEASFFHVSLVLLYHLLTVHGVWYAPLYGWLLLVSALAPRAPFIWAFLPPFVICGVEKIAFNTSHFLLFNCKRGRLEHSCNDQADFRTVATFCGQDGWCVSGARRHDGHLRTSDRSWQAHCSRQCRGHSG